MKRALKVVWRTLGVLVLGVNIAFAQEALREGDILFHSSNSAQSDAIARATKSPYTHMGMLLIKDGRAQVLEAADTVRYTALDEWIARGAGSQYVVKRLRDADQVLTENGVRELRRSAHSMLGKRYDAAFSWSDQRMYCSELVWKIYARALGVRIGKQARLRDFALHDPVVKRALRERYGKRVPLQERVISPAAMFAADNLVLVMQR